MRLLRSAIASFVDKLPRMADVPILKSGQIITKSLLLDVLRKIKSKHYAVAGVGFGVFVLIMYAIKKGFNLEINFKDGILRLLVNNVNGT